MSSFLGWGQNIFQSNKTTRSKINILKDMNVNPRNFIKMRTNKNWVKERGEEWREEGEIEAEVITAKPTWSK